MAYAWSWAWGSESAVLLNSDMGWSFESTSQTYNEPLTGEQYKPSGAPTKYSWSSDRDWWAQIPDAATTGMSQGVISIAAMSTAADYSASPEMIEIIGTGGNNIEIFITTSGALILYVGGAYKATAALATDWSSWRFVALHFDISAGLWLARVVVDGVEVIAEYTGSVAADTVGQVRLRSCANPVGAWHNGQIIIQDAYADSSPPRYVTRISPDADAATVGTWTPTTVTNHASTGVDPLNPATNTTETTPSIGDEVVTNYTGDLTAKLGGVPGTVSLVTVHSYSVGSGNTARAEVGDQAGTATTAGATKTIGSGTTYAYASAPVAPGDSAAWEGTDTPACKYEVVSV